MTPAQKGALTKAKKAEAAAIRAVEKTIQVEEEDTRAALHLKQYVAAQMEIQSPDEFLEEHVHPKDATLVEGMLRVMMEKVVAGDRPFFWRKDGNDVPRRGFYPHKAPPLYLGPLYERDDEDGVYRKLDGTGVVKMTPPPISHICGFSDDFTLESGVLTPESPEPVGVGAPAETVEEVEPDKEVEEPPASLKAFVWGGITFKQAPPVSLSEMLAARSP